MSGQLKHSQKKYGTFKTNRGIRKNGQQRFDRSHEELKKKWGQQQVDRYQKELKSEAFMCFAHFLTRLMSIITKISNFHMRIAKFPDSVMGIDQEWQLYMKIKREVDIIQKRMENYDFKMQKVVKYR